MTECVSLLPSVCEVLADPGRSLPDDTSLEKLLDWFIGLNKAGGSLLEACPCLLDFISTVVHNTAADPGVLSFTLRLTGLLAASDAGFRALQISLIPSCGSRQTQVCLSPQLPIRCSPRFCSSFSLPQLNVTVRIREMTGGHRPPSTVMLSWQSWSTSGSPWFPMKGHKSIRVCRP
uniref:BRCA1-associated ATM activator 1 n=1 Tax=Mola mola TaxID=94237 RepID=A0A3Q3W7M1_MOLML